MRHQKMINLLDNKPNEPSKFRTKKWVEINDDLHRVYSTGSPINFKTLILKSSLCYYSDVYIHVSGKIKIKGGPENATEANKQTDEINKEITLKNCASFIECTSEVNNTKTDRAKKI